MRLPVDVDNYVRTKVRDNIRIQNGIAYLVTHSPMLNRTIDVMILCGGRGSRLQSVVSDRAKSMAVIRGRPFLEWQLISLRESGFTHVILCTGYLQNSIREYFTDGKQWGLSIRYSHETEARGTGGAIRAAYAEKDAGFVVVVNGDSWCNVDFTQLIDFHESHEAIGTLALTKVRYPQRYGQVVLGHEGDVREFVEKGKLESFGWINAGMYVLSPLLLESIPENTCISLEREVFPKWVKKGLYGYAHEHQFFDIGTPDSYAGAERQFGEVFDFHLTNCHVMRETI